MLFTEEHPDYVVCQHTPKDLVERVSDNRSAIIPYGLLVRVWAEGGPEPAFFRSPVD
jgi:hypothetical protein